MDEDFSAEESRLAMQAVKRCMSDLAFDLERGLPNVPPMTRLEMLRLVSEWDGDDLRRAIAYVGEMFKSGKLQAATTAAEVVKYVDSLLEVHIVLEGGVLPE